MRLGVALLVKSMHSTDSGFRAFCAAYAIARGTVSLHDIAEELREHFDFRGNFFTRIENFEFLRKTGHRVKGTTQYEISPEWRLQHPDFYHQYYLISQELF